MKGVMKSPKALFTRSFSPASPQQHQRSHARGQSYTSFDSYGEGSPGPGGEGELRPWDVNTHTAVDNGPAPGFQVATGGVAPRPKQTKGKPVMPTASQDTPPEMIPVLSLLTAQAHRLYQEGYFMLLNDLGNDGRPVPNRQWVEVFGMLTGTQLATWDASELDNNTATAVPSYINVTDSTFKSIASLPSPSGDLSNLIVLSTTMKNRFLLQFPSKKLFDEWTAALRLATFENTSLQEAYTGALLSSKGSQLNGIRPLLGETKTKREDWCSVRFGAGMPWKRVWYVLTPVNLVKHKKDRKAGFGNIAFFESPKHVKKAPLATLTSAHVAAAVFPERAVLMNVSSLIKIEGVVRFAGEPEEKESAVFIMPEQHPGIQGFETLIRFIIPLLDIYRLYGRPQRLNADKADIRSMLFAMPTLPRVYYLDVMDLVILMGSANAENWTSRDWMRNIKEMLARKLSTGYKGQGNIHEIAASERRGSSSRGSSPQLQQITSRDSRDSQRASGPQTQPGLGAPLPEVGGLKIGSGGPREHRAVSQPNAMHVPGLRSSPAGPGYYNERNESSGSLGSGLSSGPVPASPRRQANGHAGAAAVAGMAVAGVTGAGSYADHAGQSNSPSPSGPYKQDLQAQRPAPARPTGAIPVGGPYSQVSRGGEPVAPGFSQPAGRRGPVGPRPQPHERSASEGQDPNNLIINPGNGPLTPLFGQNESSEFLTPQQTRGSRDALTNSSTSLAESAHSGSKPKNVFDPAFQGNTLAPVAPGAPSAAPSHYSYAEYSEYMQAYLASGMSKPPPTDSVEMREMVENYRQQQANGSAGGKPESHATLPTRAKNVPPPITVNPPALDDLSAPQTPVTTQAPTFGTPPGKSPNSAAASGNFSPYPSRQYARNHVGNSPSNSASQLDGSPYGSASDIPGQVRATPRAAQPSGYGNPYAQPPSTGPQGPQRLPQAPNSQSPRSQVPLQSGLGGSGGPGGPRGRPAQQQPSAQQPLQKPFAEGPRSYSPQRNPYAQGSFTKQGTGPYSTVPGQVAGYAKPASNPYAVSASPSSSNPAGYSSAGSGGPGGLTGDGPSRYRQPGPPAGAPSVASAGLPAGGSPGYNGGYPTPGSQNSPGGFGRPTGSIPVGGYPQPQRTGGRPVNGSVPGAGSRAQGPGGPARMGGGAYPAFTAVPQGRPAQSRPPV